MLSRTPVESLVAGGLSLYDSVITDHRIENAAAGFLWRLSGWPHAFGSKGHYGRRVDRDSVDRDAVVVEYWAGYQMPGETPIIGAYPLPADVERAALLTVQHWFRGGSRDPGISSTS